MKSLSGKLLLFMLMSFTFSSSAQTNLVQEGFTYGSAPGGWTQDSAGVTPYYIWSFNNPGHRFFHGGNDTLYTIFDSDLYGTPYSEDCYLNLPSLNASSLSTLLIVLKEVFRPYTGSSHQVQVSVNGGSSWVSILTDSVSQIGGIAAGTIFAPDTLVNNVYDITSIAAGQADVRIRFHYQATFGYYWAIDQVTVTDYYACTSPPLAGNAVSSADYACGSAAFNLSLVNSPGGSGQTYQWQSSPDNVNWTDITAALTASYTTSQAAATYYRCVQTCSGNSSSSTPVLVNVNPGAGTVSSSEFYVCHPADSIALKVNSNDRIAGLTYQWESSPDGINWTQVIGANLDSVSLTQVSGTYYHCVTGCGLTIKNTDSVFVGLYNLGRPGCYCPATNINTCVGTGDYISNVQIVGAALNHSSTCRSSNGNNYNIIPISASSTANLTRGLLYSISVTTSSDNIISAWFDFDGNAIYDASEWVQVCTTSVAGVANTVSFTVPLITVVGEIGLRVRSRAATTQNGAGDACLEFGSGETEDYVIGIETNPAVYSIENPVLFYLAPNPSSGRVKVNFGMQNILSSELEVFDMLGNKLIQIHPDKRSGFELDLSGFSNGMYFIRVNNGQYSQSRRLVINK